LQSASKRERASIGLNAICIRSPLRTTVGDLERLALFAGQVAGQIESIPSAGSRVEEIVSARETIERLRLIEKEPLNGKLG
jgi:hypothetical protein